MQRELQDLVDSSNLNVELKCKLGKGAFGEVYSAEHRSSDQKLAIKFERINSKYSTLQKEAKIMLMLKDGDGFARARQFRSTESMDVLVMDRLGPNLERLFKYCKCMFSLKTVLMIAIQMLDRLEYFHQKNLIHRDIKPENFVMGSVKSLQTLFLIDYGIAKLYRSQKGDHISFKEGKGLIGTARYASINSHLGNEQSRRDDLEGLGYTLIYFLRGRLKWQDAKGVTKKEKYENIKLMKMQTSIEEICVGLPKEFEIYLNYVRNLNFTESPSYGKLKQLFVDLFYSTGYELDYQYDWILVDKHCRKLPPDFYRLKTDSNYSISFKEDEFRAKAPKSLSPTKKLQQNVCSVNDIKSKQKKPKKPVKEEEVDSGVDDSEIERNREIPFTYQLTRRYRMDNGKKGKKKAKNWKQRMKTEELSKLRNTSVPKKMKTTQNLSMINDSYSNMLRIPITRHNAKKSALELYTTKTMYSSNNATSKVMNKTHLRFETENTILRYSEKDRTKTIFSFNVEKRDLDMLDDKEIADFNSADMEEEMDDIVIKKIEMLAPLRKKLIRSLEPKMFSKGKF